MNLMEDFLFEQCITENTRITKCSSTLIDHIWINCNERLLKSEVRPGFSDHRLIAASINIRIARRSRADFTCRSYKRMDITQFKHDLACINWSFLEGNNIEAIWMQWRNQVSAVIDKHTKIITIKQAGLSAKKPWIKEEELALIRKKNAAEIRVEYGPTPENIANHRRLKKEVDMMLDVARQKFYHTKIENNLSNPRKLWTILRDIAPSTMKPTTSRDTDIPADIFAATFSQFGRADNALQVYPAADNDTVFNFKQCIEEDILKIVNRIPINKATGADGIPMKAIKIGIDQLLIPLTKLTNRLMVLGFPSELKAVVLPIYKKGLKSEPSNYRPISILPCISKVAERIIADQLSQYLESSGQMTHVQHGFRRYHSTNTGLLHLTELIREKLDQGKGVGLVALDLSKAFDTIDHNILITKMAKFGLGTSAINFFINYLSDRTFIVKTPEDTSKVHRIKAGMPQGSILGPLLFNMYVNDLPKEVEHSQVVMYADDTTIMTSSAIPSNIQVDLEGDLARLEDWFNANNLTLNTNKTEFMLIVNTNRRKYFNNIRIEVGGKLIAEKEHMKILGVTLNNRLKWDTHARILLNNVR